MKATSVIGHAPILSFFDAVQRAGRMGHAYCFVGPKHAGKRTVAEHLAAQLLATTPEALSRTPDYVYVARGVHEKTGKTKKDISVDDIRDLRRTLAGRPFAAPYRVAIIREADRMSASAANALLKTLEEPSAFAILFLLAEDDAALPETVRSRCQTIVFSPVPEQDITASLIARGCDPAQAELMARAAHGLPGLALRFFAEPEFWEEQQKEISRFFSLFGISFGEKRRALEDLFGDKTDHILARQKLKQVLSLWRLLLREVLLATYGQKEVQLFRAAAGKPLATRRALVIDAEIVRAQALLEQNIHPRLLVEHMLLQFP